MDRIAEAERLVARMSTKERASFFQRMLRFFGNVQVGIDMNPRTCGGEACIIRTRIPVWLLVRARQLGTDDADLLKAYPTLRAEDLANAWAYYSYHREEIEHQILENEADE
nr:DUF433 domain-containing protein [Candidatus Sigynarchaeota archaeon]